MMTVYQCMTFLVKKCPVLRASSESLVQGPIYQHLIRTGYKVYLCITEKVE